ncbi:Zn-ribbon domain-containing OB-fold protein [Paradesulfitobacterium ferrireducens]|uniref:Zn-ribbon domain-containing OB-fold protein n=1 Tax=Paradesulfitobacterium ferrireducens TaxID=2816476 RepID=UPI001A8CA1B5|nr:zinc ribbon domain-containing protein [Paradesulfitobacterium ferrireducens]
MVEKLTWDYVYGCDPVPQQTSEFNKLHEYYEALNEGRLMTTKCDACGQVLWPPRTVCPECMSGRLSWTQLPDEGEIIVFTVQESGAFPGFTLPLIFAYLQFGPVRFIGKIIGAEPEELAPGKKVRLQPEKQEDGRILPAFRLI